MQKINRSEWYDILRQFADANIHQTWSWGALRWGEDKLSHVVLKEDDRVVAAAQCWVIKAPVIGSGVCHVKWGPLWRRRDADPNPEHFRSIVRALKAEYADKQGLLLRIIPVQVGDDADIVRTILREEGFAAREGVVRYRTYRTLVMDLAPTVDELMAGMDKRWRWRLRQAQKNDLTLVQGYDDELFGVVCRLFDEMLGRKQFNTPLTAEDVRVINRDLPEDWKLHVIIAQHEGVPVSGMINAVMGDIAFGLIAATGDRALNLDASYLTEWHSVLHFKERGCRWYDLNGYDPVSAPGPSRFKKGLAYKQGREVLFEEYEWCDRLSSRMALATAERARVAYLDLKGLVARVR